MVVVNRYSVFFFSCNLNSVLLKTSNPWPRSDSSRDGLQEEYHGFEFANNKYGTTTTRSESLY